MQDKDIAQVRSKLKSLEDPLGLMAGLFIHAPNAFAVSDADGYCVMVNQAFLNLFGSEPPPEYSILQDKLVEAQGMFPLIRQALAGQTVKTPTFWYDPSKNGSVEVKVSRRVAISITFFPVRDTAGNVSHFVMAYEDTTAESEARDRLRQVIDLAPMYIYARDMDGRYLLANKLTASAFGLEVAQVEGHTHAELAGSNTGADVRLLDDQEVLKSGQMKVAPEDSVLFRDGKNRTLYGMKVPFTASGSGKAAILGVSLDITERKEIEAQLRQSQKMDSVGRLAGGVAHDFNNLLSVILGYAEMLVDGRQEGDPEREYIDEIRHAAERAAELTKHLLAFSRQQVLELKVVDLNQILFGMEKMLRRVIGEDIEFFTRTSPDLSNIKVDSGQMEQVLMNLVINARDAMPQGGKLILETSQIDLDEAYAKEHADVRPGPHVMLAISDTGKGMDKATLARIFEPFFTTKAQGKGTGLGLSTVFGIVRQSGGHIWVYSEEGKGTTFKIYFPCTNDTRPSVAPISVKPAAVPVTETILVVEDEEQLNKLVVRILTNAGYQVIAARSGPEALKLSEERKEPIHLLLTDVVMPQMSGKQLAEKLIPLRPDMKVLYVSGYTDNSIVHHGILDTGVAFLQKPFSFDTLSKKVREVLGQE
jgi:PAS domain S-box-containing protein